MTKNKPSPSRRRLYPLLATLALTASAHAATVTWSAAATSTSWAEGANWVGGVAPVSGDDVVISADGTNDPINNSAYTGIVLNSLTLNNALGNNSVTLSSSLSVGAGGVSNTMTSGSLFLKAVNLTVDQTWGGTRTIFPGVVTGSGKLNFNGSGVRFDFNSPAWTGGVDVRSSVAMASSVTAVGGKPITPFGTGPITLINQNSATNAASSPVLGLSGSAANNSAASACTLANTIVLSSPSPNSGQFTLTQTAASAPNVGHFYLLSGDITGAVAASRTLSFTNSHDKAKAATTPATFILSGANTYAAATVIGANTTLQIGNGGTTGSLGSSTGEIKNSGTLAFKRSDAVSVANVISGTGALQQLGSGTLTLTAVNTYTGATTLSAGILAISANERIANTSELVLAGGTLALGGCTETLGTLQLSGNAGLDLGNGGKAIFAESSGVAWSPEAILSVTGNFVSGRSLRFGTRSTGLSHAQLNQIAIPGFMIEHLDANGYVIATPSAAH